MVSEQWLPIPGYEGLYEVSNQGRVRSLDRSVPRISRRGNMGVRWYRGKMKTIYADKDGYPTVSLCKGSRQLALRVSRLVLLTFVGPPFTGAEACHKNHVRSDNRPENLHWGTRQENEDEKTTSGRRPMTTVNKVTPESATLARILYAKGWSQKSLSRVLSCHLSNISLIVRGKTWQQT